MIERYYYACFIYFVMVLITNILAIFFKNVASLEQIIFSTLSLFTWIKYIRLKIFDLINNKVLASDGSYVYELYKYQEERSKVFINFYYSVEVAAPYCHCETSYLFSVFCVSKNKKKPSLIRIVLSWFTLVNLLIDDYYYFFFL